MASPKAFSRLIKSREPFDWRGFFRTFHFQPVPLWLALSMLGGPVARAFPFLSHAACQGRLRESLSSAELVVYVILAPPLLTTLYYLAVGRRRLDDPNHRLIGDVTFALMLAISLFDGAMMIARIRDQWPVLKPGLTAIRAACWP